MRDRAALPRGCVRYVVRRRGVVVERVSDSNLVVALGTTILANAIGGAAAGGVITQFAVGSNLQAPASGNTGLTGSFAKLLDGVSFPGPGQVSFQFSLAPGDADGVQIGELGLLTASGLLFARKVRQALLPKDATVSLSGSWVISW